MAERKVVVELQLASQEALVSLGKLETETRAYQRELRQLNATIAQNGTATREQQLRVAELSVGIRRNQTVLRELKNDLSGATAAGLRFRDKMADAARAGLGAFGLSTLGVVGAVTGLVGVLKSGISTIAQFDQKLAAISALGEDYATNIGKIAEVTKTVGIQFGFTAIQSADAVEELARAGLTTEQILGGALQGTLTLAASGTVALGEAAATATKTMAQFGLQASDVTHVADLLAKGDAIAIGGVKELSEALKFGGGTAHQFGVSLEETVGTLSIFAKNGLLGSEAGAALQQALLKLAKPSKDAAAAMEKYGIDVFDAQGKFIGLEGVAGQLQTKLSGLTQEQRSGALATIFGSRAIRAANILYKEGATGIADYTTQVNDAGFAQKVASEKTDNLIGATNKLSASYDNLLLQGDGIAGFFKSIVNGLTEVVDTLAGNGPDASKIKTFTDDVQKQYEKIGGSAKLAAEEGDGLVQTFRFASEAAKDGSRSIDELVASAELTRGRISKLVAEGQALKSKTFAGSSDNKAAIEANRIEQAAGLAALDAIHKRLQALGAVTIASKAAADTNGAETKTIQKQAATVGELRDKLKLLKKERDDIPVTETKLLASNALQIKATKDQIAALDGAVKKTKELTEAQKKRLEVEKEMAALASQAPSLVNGVQTSLKKPEEGRSANDPLNFATPIDDASKRQLKVAKHTAEELKKLYDEDLKNHKDYLNKKVENQQASVGAIANLAGAVAGLFDAQSAEYKAFAVTEALISTYLGAAKALTDETIPNTFASIAAAGAIIINGLATVSKIEGFADGGVVQGGQPIRRSNGDNVLITAKRGEVILNESHKQKARAIYGDDVFNRIGVPGFAMGGAVDKYTYTYRKGSGGYVRAGSGVTSQTIASVDLARAMANLPAPVVVVKDIAKGLRTAQRTRVTSSL